MEDAIFLISGKKKEEEIKKQFNNKKNKFIPIMSRDLIKYREANYSLEDNIVFIDQYLPYHPDFKLRKTKSVEPISYYKYLNDFFTKIEKKYNMEIVIAAHPSSNYEFNPFNNRKIVKFKTTEEIKKSKFIIGHYSTSLGLVTIEKKPLIIINMDIFSDSIKDCIETFSKELGVIPVNLSSNNTKIDFEKNDIFYENYYKNYLYQGKSESIPIIEILKIINNIREGKNV